MARSERRRRTARLAVRLLPEEMEALKDYSDDTGESVSEYVRRRVLAPLRVEDSGHGSR